MSYIWLLSLTLFAGDLESDVLKLIASFDGEVAVAMSCPDKKMSLDINGDVSMHAASTMKTPVMMRLFELIEKGELSLTTPIPIKNEFRSIVDGSSYQLTVTREGEPYLAGMIGSSLPLETLMETMIIHSSNLATNLLIALADAKATTVMVEEIGGSGVKVLRGVEDLKAYEKGLSNTTTASGMVAVMMACANNSRWKAESRELMLSILRRSKWRAMIPGGLPKDVGIKVANKEGQISTVQHDAAIVDLPDGTRYGLVIMTRFERGKSHEAAYDVGRKISRRIYETVIER